MSKAELKAYVEYPDLDGIYNIVRGNLREGYINGYGKAKQCVIDKVCEFLYENTTTSQNGTKYFVSSVNNHITKEEFIEQLKNYIQTEV